MPFPSITTSYAGVTTKDILQLAVLGNEAFEKGLFYIHEDIDDKGLELTRMVVASNPIQPYAAVPTNPSNSLSMTPRRVDPVKLMVYDFVNPMEFQGYWKQFQQEGPLEDKILNPQIQAAIMDGYSKRANNQIGRLIWQGDTTLLTPSPIRYFNGIVTRAEADAAVLKSAAVGSITAANVLSIFTALYAIVSDEVLDDPDFKFVTSSTVGRLFQDAIIALPNKGKDPSQKVEMQFKGKPIVTCSGFTANRILAGKFGASPVLNLHAGVNAVDDPSNLIIEKYRPEQDLYFIKALFSMDVNYGFAEEMFMYKPA
jgi:hypothetical protein